MRLLAKVLPLHHPADMSQLQLDIAVIGAGIAGLCTAIGLAQQGHKVTILESAHELAPVGIGLHIPPNATLALQHLGLLQKLEKDALQPTSFIFRRWQNSDTIVKFPASQNRADSPPLVVPRYRHTRANRKQILEHEKISLSAQLV